jgi:hypothetical protein
MADQTYQTKRYHQQGGDVDVVASGGEQKFESGATQTYESGSILADASTKTLTGVTTLSATGRVRHPVTAGSTASATAIPAGIITLDSTGNAVINVMSAAPVAGDTVRVYCETASSTGTVTLQAAAGVTFSSTAALRNLVFAANDSSAYLFAVSATHWAFIPNSTADVTPGST